MFSDATFQDAGRTGAIDDAAAGVLMDEDTFRSFYERTARGIWAYLVHVTGDRQMADDLVQETYYRFLRAATVHASDAHRRNSLYRIATNLARDARRRSLLRPSMGASDEAIKCAASSAPAVETERRADFRRAMALLKPRERAMLWMAYAEGATHREIADALGLRLTSMKILLFRARRKLAGLLGRPDDRERGGTA
jgi:RNA polymerase sigma-70 factor (ECF subfamily)